MQKNAPLFLFDGAAGTCLAERYGTDVSRSEWNNIRFPERVYDLHKEYIAAGATAIKTNTFGANTLSLGAERPVVEQIIRSGCEIAFRAADQTSVTVFASIGPVPAQDEQEEWDEYEAILPVFLSCGITHFLFETFHEYGILLKLARRLKQLAPDVYIIAECTVAADGYTTSGDSVSEIAAALEASQDVDAYGFNCTCGPMHLLHIAQKLKIGEKPVSIMPNAGYPSLVGGRTVFQNAPDYFAKQMLEISRCGVQILGGCCGTTPEHIRRVRLLLDGASGLPAQPETGKESTEHASVSSDWEKILREPSRPAEMVCDCCKTHTSGQKHGLNAGSVKQFAVELDSPLNADAEKFLNAARLLHEHGANFITIADCPVARARVDSSMLAALLKTRFGIDAMPHLTCRDRNLNATKALLLALGIQGITKVLAVTGDPIAVEDRNKVKGVFNFNSQKLIAFIAELNRETMENCPIEPAAALNVNAPNFSLELERAKRKEEAGAVRFFTQPVFTPQACDNLALAKQTLSGELFAGIMPLVSHKNACFVNNEISGITIPQPVIDAYEGKDRQEAEKIAIRLCGSIAARVNDFCDGFYIITPFQRAELVCRIMDRIREGL